MSQKIAPTDFDPKFGVKIGWANFLGHQSFDPIFGQKISIQIWMLKISIKGPLGIPTSPSPPPLRPVQTRGGRTSSPSGASIGFARPLLHRHWRGERGPLGQSLLKKNQWKKVFIKKRTKIMLGFKSFYSASATLSGIENIRMIQKGQINGQKPNQSAFENFVEMMA